MGSDYQISDASGKTWTLDEQGEVTSVGEKADTKLAQIQAKNNQPKEQPKSQNFEIQWDFSQSAFAFDTSEQIPYKALVKGKNDVFQVVIKQKDTLQYSFHFQTDKGLKVDSKKEKDGVFRISRKGLFDFANEELWVVAQNTKTEKEEIVGKCILVHLSEKEVNVTLIPTAQNLQIDIDAIQRIYAKVGVKLHISTDEIFPVEETIDTKNAFGDLSTYSPEQQDIIAWYKSERSVKSDTYYVFVGKQEGSQVGYMRLGGQFGFAFLSSEAKDLARTIAHELGHGIFRLEHPFKKDETKRGTFRTLMDYASETNFAHSDWKQINDPRLRIGFFEGQEDGEIYALKNSPMMVKRYIEYFRCVRKQRGTIHSDSDKVDVYAENIEIGGKKYTKNEIKFLGKNNQEFKNSFSPKDYQNDSKEIDNSFTNKTIVTLGKTIRFTLFPKNNFDLIGYLYSNDKSHTATIQRDFVGFVNKKTEKEVVEYVNTIDVCTLSELDFEHIKKALTVLTKNAIDKDKSEAILRLISSISEKDYSDFFALLEANNNQIIKKLINDLDDALIVGNNYYSQFVNTLVQMFVSNPNTWLGKLPKDENAVAEYFTNHYLRKTEVKITDIEELMEILKLSGRIFIMIKKQEILTFSTIGVKYKPLEG